MTAEQQALLAFFEQVARKDQTLLDLLSQQSRFRLEPECWRFTLPDLHFFLQHQEDVFGSLNYKQFRQLIFSSPINQSVKSLGAEIIITDNHAKVDRSGYALVWPGQSETSA